MALFKQFLYSGWDRIWLMLWSNVHLVVLGTNEEDGIGIADSSCRRRIEMPNWVAFGVSSSVGLVDILAKKVN